MYAVSASAGSGRQKLLSVKAQGIWVSYPWKVRVLPSRTNLSPSLERRLPTSGNFVGC